MAPLADLILTHVPLPQLPYHLTHYVHGATPLSTQPVVIGILAYHLATVFSIREIMKTRQPQKLTSLFKLLCAFLSFGSAVLLVLMLEEILSIYWRHGVFYTLCDAGAWTERMELYYIINYYIKYLELFDTVFFALEKRLAFSRVYHHSATAFLCFTQLNGKSSISWAIILQNLAFHVFTYYYFYMTAGGTKIWWKKHLTNMQIVHFALSVHIVYFGTYSKFASTYWPELPLLGSCQATDSAAFFGCAILSSYLLLFTYKKVACEMKPITNGHTNGNVFKKD